MSIFITLLLHNFSCYISTPGKDVPYHPGPPRITLTLLGLGPANSTQSFPPTHSYDVASAASPLPLYTFTAGHGHKSRNLTFVPFTTALAIKVSSKKVQGEDLLVVKHRPLWLDDPIREALPADDLAPTAGFVRREIWDRGSNERIVLQVSLQHWKKISVNST